jgi:hypothetical protein
MYLRQNATQEFIGNMRDTSQPTIFPLAGHRQPVIPPRILHDEERSCLRNCTGVVTV